MPTASRKILSLGALLLLWLCLGAWRPFTPVPSVCPSCAEKGDKVIFPDGKVLIADVVAKNQDGYILQKYGELRFVQSKELSKIEFQNGAEPRGLDSFDQILLKGEDQKVLHGTIISVELGKPMAMRSPRGNVFTVMPGQVLLYYQKGTRKAAPKDPSAT